MADSGELGPVRIGDFVFRPTTGEVRPGGAPDSSGVRLPPQPARLLRLLVDKQGELATREEIRELLWPETHVDFDQSVSFCVRQIRAALGDSAGASDYVETLPRRGYRLKHAATAVSEADEAPAPSAEASQKPRSRLALAGVALGVALIVGWVALRPTTADRAVRLAIMPFELAGEGGTETELARASEWLLAEFTTRWRGQLEVIGPRSTARYSALPFPDVRGLRDDLEIDFVVNARFFERDGRTDLIVELIQLEDGAHPWADYFSQVSGWQGIAEATLENVARALELPENPEN